MSEEDVGFVQIDLREGVTTNFLANVFGMRMETVRKRLALCPKKQVKGRGFVYSLAKACEYLVEPKYDLAEYLEAMKPEDLPPKLRKAFWDATRQEQVVKREAKELWHTEDVVEAFGAVFQTIRTTIQLWPDHVSRAEGLSSEQRKVLVDLGDLLQTDLYMQIEQVAKEKVAPNLAILLDLGDEAKPAPAPSSEEFDIIG